MRRRNCVLILTLTVGLVLAACASPAGEPGASAGGGGGEPSAAPEPSQGGASAGGGGGGVPTISARSFTGGSAQVSVSGMFTIDADIAINTVASYGDADFTWLQFGDSGSEDPNALITSGDGDAGVIVGLGSYSATGTSAECSWEFDVTDTTVSGTFSCAGVTGYNPDDDSLGTVDIEIDFTADS